MNRHRSQRAGFTLIEVMVVVVVVGVLASISALKVGHTRDRAYVTAMRSDLKLLATQEELYWHEAYAYAADLSSLDFVPSDGVDIAITVEPEGWSATATHASRADMLCVIFLGAATPVEPATSPGVVVCSGE